MGKTKGSPCSTKKVCPGMEFALDRKVGERVRIGFDFINIFDLKDGSFNPSGYAYRKTNQATPIMLTWCPFCGVDLAKLWRPKKPGAHR